jgi:tripartite-type tricarboxylate transporter receptor subunit TctC
MNRRGLLRRGADLAMLVAGIGVVTRGRAQAPQSTQTPSQTSQTLQSWPTKPLKLIVVYPTGGPADAAARLLAERLSAVLGQPVVVENKGGAGGSIGLEAMFRASADGYTLAFSALSPLTINPHLMRLPYDTLHDVAPIASVMYSPVYLIATPAFPGKNFADVLSFARAQPGKINMGTSGVASVGHLMLEGLNRSAKISLNHVPYKGGGQIISDAVSGQFQLLTANPSPALNGFIAQGKLRVIAVTGAARLPSLPHISTLAELGVPGANLTSSFGVFGPAKLPSELIRRLNREINTILTQQDFVERLAKLDNLVLGETPEQFALAIQTQYRELGALIRETGIKIE